MLRLEFVMRRFEIVQLLLLRVRLDLKRGQLLLHAQQQKIQILRLVIILRRR
jgi:hypothetical protein